MPYQATVDGKKKWNWGNIAKDTKLELVRAVYGIWKKKNGKKGDFKTFWKTGKTS